MCCFEECYSLLTVSHRSDIFVKTHIKTGEWQPTLWKLSNMIHKMLVTLFSHILYEACLIYTPLFKFFLQFVSCLSVFKFILLYIFVHSCESRICNQTGGFPHWTRISICYTACYSHAWLLQLSFLSSHFLSLHPLPSHCLSYFMS